MIKYQELLQNSLAFSIIKRDVAENMLSHAYMFISEDTAALDEFCKLFLEAVYCANDMCQKCGECKKILNRNHPDVIHIERDKNISVEDVKNIVENSYISSVEGGKKVFVIHQGEKMNKLAQNKLLKVLEEPSPNVIILFTVGNTSAILSTIKSRVKKINLDIFDSDKIYDELMKTTDNSDKAKAAAICCEGMIGKAEKLLSNESYLELYDKCIGLLTNLTHSSQIVNFIGDSMFSKENIVDTMDILMLILRDTAIVSKDKGLIIGKHKTEEIVKLSASYNTACAIGIIERIEKMKKLLYYNINNTNVAEQLMFAILEVKFRCNR